MFWSLIRARMFFPASGRGAKRQLLLPLGAVERFAGEGISLIVGYDEPALALRFFGSWLDGPDSDRAGMRLQRCIVGMHCKPFQISSGRKDDPRRALAGGLKHRIGRATSELQSLMRISYAVFCLKKKNIAIQNL